MRKSFAWRIGCAWDHPCFVNATTRETICASTSEKPVAPSAKSKQICVRCCEVGSNVSNNKSGIVVVSVASRMRLRLQIFRTPTMLRHTTVVRDHSYQRILMGKQHPIVGYCSESPLTSFPTAKLALVRFHTNSKQYDPYNVCPALTGQKNALYSPACREAHPWPRRFHRAGTNASLSSSFPTWRE